MDGLHHDWDFLTATVALRARGHRAFAGSQMDRRILRIRLTCPAKDRGRRLELGPGLGVLGWLKIIPFLIFAPGCAICQVRGTVPAQSFRASERIATKVANVGITRFSIASRWARHRSRGGRREHGGYTHSVLASEKVWPQMEHSPELAPTSAVPEPPWCLNPAKRRSFPFS